MRKNKKWLLSLTGALTVLAIPAITVVSCTQDKETNISKNKEVEIPKKIVDPDKDVNSNNESLPNESAKNLNNNIVSQALSNISDNITLSTSVDLSPDSLTSKQLGIAEADGLAYSYSHPEISNNGEFNILIAIHEKGAKIYENGSKENELVRVITVKITDLDEAKLSLQNNINQKYADKVKSELSDLKFDSSLSGISLQMGEINEASDILIDSDDFITNNYTYSQFKNLFSLKTKADLEFELEHKNVIIDPITKQLKTTFSSVNDFSLLSNENKTLDFKLQIYAKENENKKWLRSIKISFRDMTKPVLALRSDRQNISTLGKVEDMGVFNLASEFNGGELLIPKGWDNQGKPLTTWIEEQFILTDLNQNTGSNGPLISVEWAFDVDKITDFSKSNPRVPLTIRGYDKSRGVNKNIADYKMWLYVTVVDMEHPVSIIEDYESRGKRKYKLQNENGVDIIKINKSDILSLGWVKVYDEIKKIYKVLDLNYHNNFSESKFAELKFPKIKSPLISSESEVDISIKIEGILTKVAGSKNERNIKLRIIDDIVAP